MKFPSILIVMILLCSSIAAAQLSSVEPVKGPTAPTACPTSVADLSVECTGGDIIEDTMGGCRAVACSDGSGTLGILACDKPGSYNAEFYEMYKIMETGSGMELCLGDTCIKNSGFARSDGFTCNEPTSGPMCGDGQLNEPAEQCDDGNTNNGDGCSSLCTPQAEAPCECEGGVQVLTMQTIIPYAGGNVDVTAIAAKEGDLDSDPYGEDTETYTGVPFNSNTFSDAVAITRMVELDGNLLVEFTIDMSHIGEDKMDSNTEYRVTDGTNTNQQEIHTSCSQDLVPPFAFGDFVVLAITDREDNMCMPPQDPVCGDGSINQPSEQCDDGNTENGDGCSAECLLDDLCEDQALYAVYDESGADSTVFKFDIDSGIVTEINTVDDADIEAMDTNLATDVIFGMSGSESAPSTEKRLIEIDPVTGIPPLGTGIQLDLTSGAEYESASFRPGTNDLWASGDSNIGLRIVNLATGNSVQQVAVSGSVEAMAWNLDGSVLYFIKNVDGSGISDLYKYVPGDGVTLLCEDLPSEIEAMEMDFQGQLVVGLHEEAARNSDVLNPFTCQFQNSAAYNIPDPYTDLETLTFVCLDGEDPFCGDGTVNQQSEECDGTDGVPPGYVCTDACMLEPLPICGDGVVNQPSEECDGTDGVPPGYQCTINCTLIPPEPFCGDGDVNQPSEQCDDGNNDNNDGCNSFCLIEFCGDGVQQDDEQCDDGNKANDDGCNVLCEITFCGDNITQDPNGNGESEQCDDGNNDNGDGCSEFCMVEDPMCGDGTLDHGEQCDDGNKMDGDGCSAQCVIEFCGDGLINLPKEQCDDGNNKDGDGCSAKCQLESNSTCVEALDQGLLFGEITSPMSAEVTNNGPEPYTVSLASYEMFAELIVDQLLWDYTTVVVNPGETKNIKVGSPDCRYQLDLVCGAPLVNNPQYGDRLIDGQFHAIRDEFCTPHPNRFDESVVDVGVADWFPQGLNYIFECDVTGFAPTQYFWYFGDGDIQPFSNNQNVWHTYGAPGEYTVACSATDGDHWQTGVLGIVAKDK